MSLSDKVAIVGVGATAQGKLPGRSSLDLGLEAFRRALDDAGLKKSDIDGILTMPGTTSPEGSLHYIRFGEAARKIWDGSASKVLGHTTSGPALQQNLVCVMEANTWHPAPQTGHSSVVEDLCLVRKWQPRRTYLTHYSGHEDRSRPAEAIHDALTPDALQAVLEKVRGGFDIQVARHGVTLEEVEEVVFGAPLVLRTSQQRYLLIGQTTDGRYLTIALGTRRTGV